MDITAAKSLAKSIRPNKRRLVVDANESLALYYGGQELDTLILPWSQKEDPENYIRRKAVTMDGYRPFPAHIVSKYLESIARAGTIKRECNDKAMNAYLQSHYSRWFWTEVAPYLFILPELFVQSVYPPSTGDIQTQQDAVDMQGNPHCVVHFPQFVRNFGTDEVGNIEWITMERPVLYFPNASGFSQSIMMLDHYQSGEYMTFQVTADGKRLVENKRPERGVTEPTAHGFTRTPFVRFAYTENNALAGQPKIGHSRLASVIKGSKFYLDFLQMLTEAAYIHLRLTLVGPKDSARDIQKAGGLGNSTFIQEDSIGDSVHPLRYLDKPRTEIELLDMITFERIVTGIFEEARLREPSVMKGHAQSGIAKLLDMVPDLGVNQENCDWLQSCDQRIMDLMIIGTDSTDPLEDEAMRKKMGIVCQYPLTLDIKTINERIEEVGNGFAAIQNGGLPRSRTADSMIVEGLYKELLPEVVTDVWTKISEEIAADAAVRGQARLSPTAPQTQAVPYQRAPTEGGPVQ